MIVTPSDVRGVAVVRPFGRIDLGPSLVELRETLAAILAEPGTHSVVLELSDVTYVDSATLGEIMASCRRARQGGGALAVAGASGKVADLLSLTRLDRLIGVHRSLHEALAAVGAGRRAGTRADA